MKTYGYEVKWANVKFELINEGRDIKINAKNLPKSVNNIKFAIYGSVKDNGTVDWLDGSIDKDGVWSAIWPKSSGHGKVFIDVYSEVNGKLIFIDSDFNELDI